MNSVRSVEDLLQEWKASVVSLFYNVDYDNGAYQCY